MRERNTAISGALGGTLVGVGLMYLLDPDRGARRRAMLRDRAIHVRHRVGDNFDTTARDLRNRTKGTVAQLRSRFQGEPVDDEILRQRVRSAVGRAVSHPRAITSTVRDGRVTLEGPVLEHEVPMLLRLIRRVRGVTDVVNALEVYQEPGAIPGLQGGRPRKPRTELAQDNWAPATRMLAGALGSLAVYGGMRARRPLGLLLATAGAGILTRALTNLPVKRLTGIRAGRRAVDVQKTINVAAPVAEVWNLWSQYENFPRFMSHLQEVRRTSEDGRSHWSATGPAGSTIEWDAVTTVWAPEERIAWKSVDGSAIQQAGIVEFRPNPDGTTRIDIRMSYNPPGGAIGHAAASLFGVDPEHAMDEDMMRLKSLLEEGQTSAS